MKDKKIRVLLGKLGLDTHDRGIRVVASAIRDAGMEIIYSGVFQSEEATYQTAIEEDVDVVGLSFLCGGHIEWMERVIGYFKGSCRFIGLNLNLEIRIVSEERGIGLSLKTQPVDCVGRV